ncbi:uncharacterized protein V3H82_020458 [Fundulus diaphanus]
MFQSSHGDDINSLTECITDYMNFCVESIVPTRRLRCFPNNPRWVTPELKVLLNQKKRAFYSGDREEQRRVQRELQWKIRAAKKDYGKKMEEQLAQNNVRDVWRGLKNISGFGQKTSRAADGDTKTADELNSFFTRFDSPHTGTLLALNSPHVSNHQPSRDLPSPPPPLRSTTDPSTPSALPSSPLTVTPMQVRG